MNVWDILILLLITGAVVLSLRVLHGKRSRGGCSCGCDGCTRKCNTRQDEKAKTNR